MSKSFTDVMFFVDRLCPTRTCCVLFVPKRLLFLGFWVPACHDEVRLYSKPLAERLELNSDRICFEEAIIVTLSALIVSLISQSHTYCWKYVRQT